MPIPVPRGLFRPDTARPSRPEAAGQLIGADRARRGRIGLSKLASSHPSSLGHSATGEREPVQPRRRPPTICSKVQAQPSTWEQWMHRPDSNSDLRDWSPGTLDHIVARAAGDGLANPADGNDVIAPAEVDPRRIIRPLMVMVDAFGLAGSTGAVLTLTVRSSPLPNVIDWLVAATAPLAAWPS